MKLTKMQPFRQRHDRYQAQIRLPTMALKPTGEISPEVSGVSVTPEKGLCPPIFLNKAIFNFLYKRELQLKTLKKKTPTSHSPQISTM